MLGEPVTISCGGHEPSAQVARDDRFRPLLERGDENALRWFLGKTDVAHDAREAGYDPGGLGPPDLVRVLTRSATYPLERELFRTAWLMMVSPLSEGC